MVRDWQEEKIVTDLFRKGKDGIGGKSSETSLRRRKYFGKDSSPEREHNKPKWRKWPVDSKRDQSTNKAKNIDRCIWELISYRFHTMDDTFFFSLTLLYRYIFLYRYTVCWYIYIYQYKYIRIYRYINILDTCKTFSFMSFQFGLCLLWLVDTCTPLVLTPPLLPSHLSSSSFYSPCTETHKEKHSKTEGFVYLQSVYLSVCVFILVTSPIFFFGFYLLFDLFTWVDIKFTYCSSSPSPSLFIGTVRLGFKLISFIWN